MFLLDLVVICLTCSFLQADATPPSPDAFQCEIFCSDATYDAAGSCPSCDIPLRTVASIASKLSLGKTAGILIFPGVQVIDFSGPHEVLGAAGFRVVTVAKNTTPLRTDEGLAVIPDHDFASCPELDVLVLPGGKLYPDEESIAWIQAQAASAGVEHLLSVCNGLGWLHAANLIEGREVATTAVSIPRLLASEASFHLRTDRRVVESDRIISSGGYTSGIDGALQVVARIRGEGAAELIATKLEYDWRPDVSMFPERRAYYLHLRTLLRILERDVEWLQNAPILEASCEAEYAMVLWSLPETSSPTAVISQIAKTLDSTAKWHRDDQSSHSWRSSGDEIWEVEVEPVIEPLPERHLIRLTVSRKP